MMFRWMAKVPPPTVSAGENRNLIMNIVLRLEVQIELMARHCIIHLVDYAFLIELLLVRRVVVTCN